LFNGHATLYADSFSVNLNSLWSKISYGVMHIVSNIRHFSLLRYRICSETMNAIDILEDP